jgi:hypothetical protein
MVPATKQLQRRNPKSLALNSERIPINFDALFAGEDAAVAA